ncbi:MULTISPECIES: HAD hydrolase-like protein [unclassified Campylobacter]|uniref:HAD hydrolase-like protein n=1 Tax=unclassified Campylobacter TaxID=2593542 RepID=UPI001237A4CB|nr:MULTISPECIES: HAD hydrolase-like protein [unclassified Campylobacter]KAA6224765.1 hypothetical protein FMM57_08550 [Campylobacter sp. LR286c]KAA6224871.1 hypothetical protein FMM55_08520 [Campylobacter sp. LR196d]KAA6228860.1 hypothetical protein FMM54_00020 [Campylobacter sp. LR185c]KAA6233423.1 hypothetical protein FMM58_02290 [Campylobacter sp. LR291e]KAA6233604.1 hypothetical protein FMM56_03010 [Campylobacter sp. LR264d]
MQEIRLFNNVKSTFSKLRNEGIKISVVTSKDYQNALSMLKYFKLEVDCLIVSNSPLYKGKNKSFDDPLLFACVQTHITIDESIFVGDI